MYSTARHRLSTTTSSVVRLTLETLFLPFSVGLLHVFLANPSDEAHKASGSYAYTTILAYITAHHPYFRVLALTATPGGDVPKVQGVVDALHISRIEIREAEAPEIRKYMNEKKTETHVVLMGSVIEELRDRWAAIMKVG